MPLGDETAVGCGDYLPQVVQRGFNPSASGLLHDLIAKIVVPCKMEESHTPVRGAV